MPTRAFHPDIVDRILLAVPDLVLVIDSDDRIQYMNRVPAGYDRDAMLGKPVGLTVPIGQRLELLRAIRSAREFGDSLACTLESTRHDGTTAWWECRICLLRAGGDESDVVVVARDVTQLQQAEAERKIVVAELDRVMELLPICAWCKRVRDDSGYWEDVSKFIEQEVGTGVTHGICPDCTDKYLPADEAAS